MVITAIALMIGVPLAVYEVVRLGTLLIETRLPGWAKR